MVISQITLFVALVKLQRNFKALTHGFLILEKSLKLLSEKGKDNKLVTKETISDQQDRKEENSEMRKVEGREKGEAFSLSLKLLLGSHTHNSTYIPLVRT